MGSTTDVRVLHLCFSPGWGGLEMYPARVAPHLVERGAAACLAARAGSPLARAVGALGLPLLEVKPSPLGLFGVPRLIRFIREQGVNVLHCHKSSDLLPASLAARRTHVVLCFTEHMGGRHAKRDAYHRWVYRRVDQVFAISDETRGRNLTTLPVAPERIATLHHGVDLEQYGRRLDEAGRRALREELGLPPAGALIGAPGRLCRDKGQLTFLEAAARLKDRLPDATFLVIGGLRPEEGAEPGFAAVLERRVAELGLTGRVRFSGFRRDVARVFELLDVACVPSRNEAFGLVVIEAMAASVPVLATNAGGIPELLRHGREGLLFEPGDAGALAGQIEELVRDPERARAMGLQGRRSAEERFSQARHVDALLGHYRRLLDARRGGQP